MDFIKKKINIYVGILPLIHTNIDKLAHAGRHIYDLMDSVNELLNSIQSNIDTLTGLDIHTPSNIFNILHLSNTLSDDLNKIISKLNVNIATMPSEMSNTYITILEKDTLSLNIKYEILKLADVDITNIFIHNMLTILVKYEIDIISSIYNKFTNTAVLYSHYLQLLLNKTDEKSEKYSIILNKIEDAKYKIFSRDIKKQPASDNLSLQRFGLTPAVKHILPNDIIKSIFDIVYSNNEPVFKSTIGYNTQILSDVSGFFKEKKIGLFVMVKIGISNVAYNFDKITTKSKDNMLLPLSGITDTVIDRFDVINIKDNVPPAAVFINYRIGYTESDRWVIVQTMDGLHFDIMRHFKYKDYFDTAFVCKIERGPSNLINEYQKTCVENIESFITIPVVVPVSEYTGNTFVYISKILITRIIAHIDIKLDHSMPTKLKELFFIVNNDDIESIINDTLIQSYENDVSDMQTDVSSEIFSTFLSNSHNITSIFMKFIKDGTIKYNFTEFMFLSKTKQSLTEHIRKGILYIITEAANKAFDPTKNIYEGVHNKKKMLNILL
jgi:hypothetical protein